MLPQAVLEDHPRLLADICESLTSATDAETCLRRAAALMTPGLCDAVAIDEQNSDFAAHEGALRRVAFSLSNKPGVFLELLDRPEVTLARDHVLELGEPERSSRFLIAPLFSRGRVLGTLTMVTSDRELGDLELMCVRELARRMARVIEYSRLCAEAEAVSRTKEEFLATLSHELRTPLTAILGWSHMLRNGELDPCTREKALDSIERNARSQVRIIEEMIELSRTLTGSLKLELRTVSLGSLAESVASSLRTSARSKKVELRLLIDRTVPPMVGDPVRLRQIVWNLLSNGIKFTPAGGWVELQVFRESSEVVLAVRDSGEGIPRAFLPRVFDPFSQCDGSSTRRHGGLGLGLAIVRHLTEIHGGRVSAESDGENRGARFCARFPMAISEIPRTMPSSDNIHGVEPGALRGLKVAVIDDEPDALAIVGTVLGLCGADVRTLVTPEIEELAMFAPDVIVASGNLPLELGHALHVGLEKPVEPQELVSRITRVLFRAA
jgi:signal transduction histidine kinase